MRTEIDRKTVQVKTGKMKVSPNKDNVSILAKEAKSENEKFVKQLKKKPPKNLDEIVHELHEEAFDNFDCLNCANCCSSISPMITDKDVERLTKPLKLKPSQVIEQYMHLVEDQDYVFNHAPCPFLMADNYCAVYEFRPKACREYPHTHQPEVLRKSNLHIKNSTTCPAVFEILETIRKTWI